MSTKILANLVVLKGEGHIGLRLPFPLLGSLRFRLDPQYLACLCLVCVLHARHRVRDHPMDAKPFGLPVRRTLRLLLSQGGDGSLKFPGYPSHMPRSYVSAGALLACLSANRTLVFHPNQNVDFHCSIRSSLSVRSGIIQFSEIDHAAYALTPPGFMQTLLGSTRRFISVLVASLL